MSYYAIGFGGTGAKCIEALIHLCAAGMMPNNEELNVLFVDQDDDNGSLGRAQELLKNYEQLRSNRVGDSNCLKTPITPSVPDNWLPESDDQSNLESFIQYPNLTDEFRSLFDVLYTKDERITALGQGFRGRPAIGSAIFAAKVSPDVDPWKAIKHKLDRDASGSRSKIILMGSIFGGTGAAGVPTISRIFDGWAKDFPENPFSLGSVLVLPYFTFRKNEKDELHADARDFLLNTQSALQYYQQHDYLNVFDKSYILGCSDLRDLGKAEIGSRGQENPPHWIEMIAALAAIDFFSESTLSGPKYNLIARESAGSLQWSDLPYKTGDARQQLVNLVRFAFAYLAVYFPAIKDARKEKYPYWAPWFIDFFKRNKADVQSGIDAELGHCASYCRRFLSWMAGIEYSITGNPGTRKLVDYSSFAELKKNADDKLEITLKDSFTESKFVDFELGDKEAKSTDLALLWERMCESYTNSSAEEAGWRFLTELYREAGR
jgi:hypothetical protein